MVFQKANISNAVASDAPAMRANPLMSNVMGQLGEYGCWCAKVQGGKAHEGASMDELDEMCRQWSKFESFFVNRFNF